MAEKKENPHEGHREKLRQRFIRENGFEHFEDHQILELLLFYANPRGDTNPTAHALLNEFGSLKGVLEARPEMLMTVNGVGERAATLISHRTERFYVISLNAKCAVLGRRKISDGSLSEVSAYPRMVMETALNYNAHSVLLCHNHPGGTCAPSPEDIASTIQLQQLLNGVGIMLLDHIIVANDSTYSMIQHGDIDYRVRNKH